MIQNGNSTFNRREMLTTTALTAAGLVLGCRRADAAPREVGEKVVVIGAGIAGLAAATALKAAGRQVIVLERSNRVGGRMLTDRSWGGVPIDLGAAWIEGTRRNPLTPLARKFKVKGKTTNYDKGTLFDADGEEIESDGPEMLEEGLDEMMEEMDEGQARNLSVEDAVRQAARGIPELNNAQGQRVVNYTLAGVEVEFGAESSDISVLGMEGGEEFEGPDVLMHGGYDLIAQGLARELDVRFNTSVWKIAHDSSGVTITTDQGTFTASAAIVTVALGALKAGLIEFSPALPKRKLDAIQRLKMGVVNKVILQFPSLAFPPRQHFFYHAGNTKGEFPEFLNLYPFRRQPILVGAVGGNYARSLEDYSDDDVRGAAMTVLRKMLGSSLPDPVNFRFMRMSKIPHLGGAYSYVPLGVSWEEYDIMAEPVGERLLFAGEATNSQYPATVHGAYLSGIREANRILGRV